jgi:hypothetical protein|tara:strand:- start:222 stop:659 length:438 start_codon:yes stop_codon:yes gene_type:complete
MKDISCLVGISMLIGSLSMTVLKKDTTIFKKFYDLLNDEQKIIYEGIVKERLMIYFSGMIIGLGLGIYYYIGSKDKYRLCKFLAIIYLVKLGFYYFYPKRPLMLYSLNSQDQVDAWADIYTEMKNKYKKSLLIGFAGYLLISYKY